MVLEQKRQKLEKIIHSLEKVLVCFSGGTDSSLLLFLCVRILGTDRVRALTVESQASWDDEIVGCRNFAARLGVPLIFRSMDILKIRQTAENDPRRCYFCKKNIFELARREAQDLGIDIVAEGSNEEDQNDFRPGFTAIKESGIRSPLLEAGLNKTEVRALSRQWALPTWNTPPTTCLLTRFPYGASVTAEKLHRVKKCETFLRAQGFPLCRVRSHGELARIEVTQEDICRLTDPSLRELVLNFFKKAGFLFVSLDLEGYRHGAMNRELRINSEFPLYRS